MAVSRMYGKVQIPTVGEDEPVFILRGKDILAQSAMERYRAMALFHGCRVAEAVAREIESFRQWPEEKRLPVWPLIDGPATEGCVEGAD